MASKNHTAISISRENYDKIVKMGNMKTSFNDIVTDLLNKNKNKNKADAEVEAEINKEGEMKGEMK